MANSVKIIPLGGLGEIGKNLTVFETDNDILIVDCGMGFPDETQLGVDIIIPDTSYLDNKADKIRGIVITHGHEDHIGAIPYFLKKFPDTKIYGTRLTLGIVEHKLNEHKLENVKKIVVKSGEKHKFGKDFSIEFIKVNHSIAGAVALAIKTPAGIVFHTGDFKIDLTPTQGKVIDLSKFAEYGNKGVKLLMCDSTNAERNGSTSSEKSVATQIDELFKMNPKKRIIIATFSSNMYRIQSIINSALKYNRKVCFNGRSMSKVVETSIDLGYIKIDKNDIVDIDDVNEYLDEEIAIITTGSQGEPMSALYRMAFNEHKQVSLCQDDLVILSSHTIPGNEKLVNEIINRLIEKGVKIAYDDNTSNIHVSGHACRDELKIIHSLLKPEFFMPVHGEIRHLYANKDLGMSMGIPEENIIISKIGKVIALTKDSIKEIGEVQSGNILIDGNGVGDVGNIVINDRKILAKEGIVIAVIKLDKDTKEIIGKPDIISRGFVFVRESDILMKKIEQIVLKEVKKCSENNIDEWKEIKKRAKDGVSKYIYNTIKRNPMILPVIIPVEQAINTKKYNISKIEDIEELEDFDK